MRLAVFAAAFLFILAHPFHWPPQSDAAHYVYASGSLLAGDGWQPDPASPYWDTDVYAEWPPLQSLALAAIRWLGFDAYTAARLLNAACYAAVVLLVWQTAPKWCVLPLLTPVFTVNYQSALSEPLFILLVAVFLRLLVRDPLPLAKLAVIGALCWLQRYSGMFVFVFGVGYILLRPAQRVVKSG